MTRTFNVHGQAIQARTFDAAYAIRFNCTVAEAIADRDEPQTELDLVARFEAATGRKPTHEEMQVMHPEPVETVQEYAREWRLES